jgi:hypothetical protein
MTPSTLYVTASASGTSESCAWNVWSIPTKTAAELGYTDNVPLAELLITFTEVDTEGGLVFVPVAVTVQEPAVEGAVNKPDLLIVPQVALQVTIAFVANCSVVFTTTVGLVGVIERGAVALPDPDSAT